MDKGLEGVDAVAGAVGSEGEDRQSLQSTGTLSIAHEGRPLAPLAPGQRWSLARKRDVVIMIVLGPRKNRRKERRDRRLGGSRFGRGNWIRRKPPRSSANHLI